MHTLHEHVNDVHERLQLSPSPPKMTVRTYHPPRFAGQEQRTGRERRSHAKTGRGDRGDDVGGWSGMGKGAQTTEGVTPVKCMDSVWQTTPQSTASTNWANVPGFSDHPIAIYPIAIDVSALVSGAPVEFRILSTNVGGQTFVSKPGSTRFAPGRGGPDSFAYQWIERDQVAATHSNFLRLQWRSPSGAAVRLQRGAMSLLYTTDACQGSS